MINIFFSSTKEKNGYIVVTINKLLEVEKLQW